MQAKSITALEKVQTKEGREAEKMQQKMESLKDKVKLLQQENTSFKTAKVTMEREMKQLAKQNSDYKKEVSTPNKQNVLSMILSSEKHSK